MKTILLLIFFLTSSFLYAKIKKFEVYSSDIKKFSFKEVCKLMKKEDLIIDIVSTNAIDCMGDVVTVNSFCKEISKKDDERSFLRGYVEKKDQTVLCQSGKSAVFSLSCDKKDSSYCNRPSHFSCEKIKKIFTEDLKLEHSSIIENENSRKNLNCYFGQGIKDKKLSSRMQ